MNLLQHNSQDQLGEKLWDASHAGKVEQVQQLLEEGAPVNWRDGGGWSSLHAACQYNRAEVVMVLLRYNPLMNQPSWNRRTPQHSACSWDSLHCLKLLLATGQCDLG